MAVSFNSLIDVLNETFKTYIKIGYGIEDAKKSTINLSKLYHPNFNKIENEIQFNGKEFSFELKELQPGIDFYETEGDYELYFY